MVASATLNLLCQEIQRAARCLDGWIQNKGTVILLCVTVGRGRTTLMMEEPLSTADTLLCLVSHTHMLTPSGWESQLAFTLQRVS